MSPGGVPKAALHSVHSHISIARYRMLLQASGIIYQYLVTIVFIITEFVYRSTGCVYVYTGYCDFVSMNVVSS